MAGGTNTGEIQIWGLKTKAIIYSVAPHSSNPDPASILCLRFDRSSRHLAYCTSKGHLNIINMANRQRTLSLIPSQWPLRRVAFSPLQGSLISTVSEFGVIDVWDTQRISSGHNSKEGLLMHEQTHTAIASTLAFSTMNRFVFIKFFIRFLLYFY